VCATAISPQFVLPLPASLSGVSRNGTYLKSVLRLRRITYKLYGFYRRADVPFRQDKASRLRSCGRGACDQGRRGRDGPQARRVGRRRSARKWQGGAAGLTVALQWQATARDARPDNRRNILVLLRKLVRR
jgi:hypothetical protein